VINLEIQSYNKKEVHCSSQWEVFIMTKIRFYDSIFLILASILFATKVGRAQTSASAALAGLVSSQEEGPMEGVLVSAKKAGSSFTVTVVSDAQGRYSFPQNRLEAGQYTLRIRAVGYDLEGPGTAEIAAQKTTALDLKLRKTQDLAAQLSNAEWLMSVPGTGVQKSMLYCSFICHTAQRTIRSHHTAAEWTKVMQRMGNYHPGSIPEYFQLLPKEQRKNPSSSEAAGTEGALANTSSAMAVYLSQINLSAAPEFKYPLKTLPRPKGKGTKAIVTQYDLPRPHTIPHDMTVDSKGNVWYCDFGQQYLGRLDPKTAKVVEYPVPLLKPDFPKGCRTLEFDPDGNVWISMDDQGAAGKLDLKTGKFQTWSVPKSQGGGDPRVTNVQPGYQNLDGKVWAQTPRGAVYRGGTKEEDTRSGVQWRVQRLDARSGEWEQPIDVYGEIPKNSPWAKRPHNIYDIFPDPQNNVYFTDLNSELIGKIDAKTKKVTFYETPTYNSAPRRGHFDSQGRFWFGEDRAGRFAMFDPKTEKFQEWPLSTPYSGAYDVVLDKNGFAWTGSMQTDRITRLNVKTGEMVEYLLPRFTNIRKVEVDNSTNPVSFWVADDEGASLVRLEALE
jgi:streptogramin lyase